jgi:DOPA 4,5-dioxygenase
MANLDPATIEGWHAHIYYDPDNTKDRATALREKIADAFPDALIGSWHDEQVGPHTRSMYQVVFSNGLFPRFVPFLAAYRDGLAILVHAEGTDDGKAAHTEHAIWMGEILPVKTAQWEGTRG